MSTIESVSSRAEGSSPAPPSLKSVLARRSSPPVCLYNYYLYLRDHEQAQHYLDFWLDVSAHENRCKVYCKNIIRASKRPSGVPESGTGTMSIISDASGSQRFRMSRQSDQMPAAVGQTFLSEATAAPSMTEVGGGAGSTGAGGGSKKVVTREEIQRSARKLYRRYMIPGARRELHFPDSIRYPIVQAIEVEGRDDPEIYQEAKEYVFRLMEQCYFPRFIQERSQHNIGDRQALIRLVVGLLLLFIGFTVALSLIFLDRPRRLRWYSLLPISFAVTLLFAYLARFCPVFTLFRTTETGFLRFASIEDPFTLRRHRIKALSIFGSALAVSLVIVGIFVAVPGHRL
ncbi:RGS domain-containing protein [Thamnocephalis sphaerospora]|uniref:RGS domain-containing protein n=1 Tax=Thamnocephalis sphaerospora TaxID=78915 RepID=A0A4P9XLW8_9FUNG|nr:RGS domain-containing protein [Thamnocephalis sphaerospora]|eukprot:RKP06887.1 RGS domain-containing protein [Thamnocephalis sphaerospora]